MPPLPQNEFLAAVTDRVCLVGPLFQGRYVASIPTIYVDGGADFADMSGAVPSLRIGDRDSATSSAMDIVLPREKDRSDLACALALLPASVREIHLLGFLGGRRDHELIGLGEVYEFLHSHSARAEFDEAILGFSAGSWTFAVHGTFSLITFAENSVRLGGACKYPLDSRLGVVSSRGLSNEGSGKIQMTCDQPLYVLLNQ